MTTHSKSVLKTLYYGISTLAVIAVVAADLLLKPRPIPDSVPALQIVRNVGHSVAATLACFAASLVIAVLLASFTTRNHRRGRTTLTPGFVLEETISAIRFMPALAWLPFSTKLWVHAWEGRALFIIVGTFPHIFYMVAESLRRCPYERIFAGASNQASQLRTFLLVVVPDSLDQLIAAMRQGLALAFILRIVYEFQTKSTHGVAQIMDPNETQRYTVPEALAFVVLLFVVGVMLNGSIQALGFALSAIRMRSTVASV